MSIPEQFVSIRETTTASLDDRQTPGRSFATDAFCVVVILGFVLLSYVATANVLTAQDEKVVPSCDPFTYTLGFMEIHDMAHTHLERALRRCFSTNWYWLQNIITLALSPFVGSQPASMAAMNYICLAIGLCALYAVGRQLTNSPVVALLGVAGIMHLPGLYGTTRHGQLLCVTLDCSFLWMVAAAWSCTYLYAQDPGSRRKAFLAAATTSLAICGRGNSLPIIGLVLAVPLLTIAFKLISRATRANFIKPAAIYGVIVAHAAGIYLWVNLPRILDYYAFLHHDQVTTGLYQKLSAICSPPGWVLCNIPATIVLSRHPDTVASQVSSVLIHIFMLAAGGGLFWHARRMQTEGRRLAFLVTSMLSIYIATFGLGNYAIMGVEEHRTFHVYNMMLLAFSVMVMATIIVVVRQREALIQKLAPRVLGLVGTTAFVCAFLFSKQHVHSSIDLAGASPSEVRAVSIALNQITGGRPLAVMWYGNYNTPILNYYRFLERLPSCNVYADFHTVMFHPVAENVDPQRFRNALRTTLEEADFVLVPQNPADYRRVFPSKMQRDGGTELSSFYAEIDRPDYRVRMVLHDVEGTRLLLLERLEEHAAPGTPHILPRPFQGSIEERLLAGVTDDKASRVPDGPRLFSLRTLLDANPKSFWETHGPFPHTVRVENHDYASPVVTYRLCADAYAPDRMPTAWRVEGSHDSQAWVTLDQRSDVQWAASTSLEFEFNSPIGFRFIQFVFEKGQDGIVRVGDIAAYKATPTGREPVAAHEFRITNPQSTVAKSDDGRALR